jgi:hypothetical protein
LTVTHHAINVGGPFADALRRIILERKPHRVLETGTYDGLGSTQVIASAVPADCLFISIEVNRELVETARANLKTLGLGCFVVSGLSLYQNQIPAAMDLPDAPFADHEPAQRAARYVAETANPEREGMMDTVFRQWFGGDVDLVLLDSAGHLGWLEFQEALSLIRSPCVIALDDTLHVKHCRSLAYIKAHPERFTILAEGNDRCGWCIADYSPA